MKKFSIKIAVLVSYAYSVHDKVREIWLFIREFHVAVMFNSSQKHHFI